MLSDQYQSNLKIKQLLDKKKGVPQKKNNKNFLNMIKSSYGNKKKNSIKTKIRLLATFEHMFQNPNGKVLVDENKKDKSKEIE